MKYSIWPARSAESTGRRIVMSLAMASLMGALSLAPAFAEHDDGHDRQLRGERVQQREWRRNRDRAIRRDEYRRHHYYAQPVYAPPPVYYAPRQSPGINLFFPLDIRR